MPIVGEVLVDRREFLAATASAAVSPTPALDTLAQSTPRQYIELRRYHLLPGEKQRAFISFVGDTAALAVAARNSRLSTRTSPTIGNGCAPHDEGCRTRTPMHEPRRHA